MKRSNYTTENCVIANETEKAIALKAWATDISTKKTWPVLVWVPRSIISGTIIPDWSLGKKFSEAYYDGKDLTIETI